MMSPKLFKRQQNEESRKRTEYQIYMGRENPKPEFDLSNCQLSEVPGEVYSMCKVLLKQRLILDNNWLQNLDHKRISSLRNITEISIENNELKSLPNEISQLKRIEVLMLGGNELTKLPDTFQQLTTLKKLSIRGNKFKKFPKQITSLTKLRHLDIRSNPGIKELPHQLSNFSELAHLSLDPDKMTYPPPEVCSGGIVAIMEFMCKAAGVKYVKPVYPTLDEPDTCMVKSHSFEMAQQQKEAQRAILLEQQRTLEAQVAAVTANDKRDKSHLLKALKDNDDKLSADFRVVQLRRDEERKRLLSSVQMVENQASDLIDRLLRDTEKAKKNEAILREIEQDQARLNEWFTVKQEQLESLRKQEVLEAMKSLLADAEIHGNIVNNYLNDRLAVAQTAHRRRSEADARVDSVLLKKQNEHNRLVDTIMHEERMQKEAFEFLQIERDNSHQRITGQIALIEGELIKLTLVEIEQKKQRQDEHEKLLVSKREQLSDMLALLLKEKSNRECELRQMLEQMDRERDKEVVDYWLVQYQRLMDSKPKQLLQQENALEPELVDLLRQSNATDYISQFAKHQVTFKMILHMSDSDLKQLGVREIGVRQQILDKAQDIDQARFPLPEMAGGGKEHVEYSKPSAPLAASQRSQEGPSTSAAIGSYLPPPSAGAAAADVASSSRPAEDVAAAASPSAPPPSMIKTHVNAECVICMELQSCVVFLNCGHVCACAKCSQQVAECPLCRQPIVQRVKLSVIAVV